MEHYENASNKAIYYYRQYVMREYERRPKSASAVIPTEPHRPRPGKEELEFLSDSPEVLAQTIADIGYREKLDNAFEEAILRVKGLK